MSCTGLCHLTLITSQFQKQYQETVFGRSLVIFIFVITPIFTMIIITRSDSYLTLLLQISKRLCLQINSVSMKVWYIMVDTVPISLVEKNPYNLGLNFGVYLVRWIPSSCRVILCKIYQFDRNRMKARFWCFPRHFHYVTSSR